MVGSHIKNLLGGIKGVWGLEWADAFFFFFYLFFLYFAAAAAAGARMCKNFTLRLLEVEIFFFRG